MARRPARQLRGLREVDAGQQQRKFLAAIARDQHGVFQRDDGQRFADPAQAGVAHDVAIVVVEQLEMIDIDHHQRDRLVCLGGLLPLLLQPHVETAAIGEAGEAVEASQLVEMLVGDMQFLLARGELARHVVERAASGSNSASSG